MSFNGVCGYACASPTPRALWATGEEGSAGEEYFPKDVIGLDNELVLLHIYVRKKILFEPPRKLLYPTSSYSPLQGRGRQVNNLSERQGGNLYIL
jgi:hypothetical protein